MMDAPGERAAMDAWPVSSISRSSSFRFRRRIPSHHADFSSLFANFGGGAVSSRKNNRGPAGRLGAESLGGLTIIQSILLGEERKKHGESIH
jgi:hypothetical protein